MRRYVASHTRLLPVHTIRSAPPAGRTCLSVRLARLARHRAALADAHRLDAIVTNGLNANRVAVRRPGVPALWQPAELGEHEAADRVVRVAVDRQVQAVVGQVGDSHV